jgi:rod shape-determining protein MreC
MIRKNWFYISLIIIYLIFLTKDSFMGLINNKDNIANSKCTLENNSIIKDYEKLLNFMNLTENKQELIYSKVITREIYEFYDKITITKNENDNIKKGDIVISEYGLIGTISKVNKNSCEVSLITSNDTNISVKVGESYGILYSKNHKLKIKNMKIEGSIKEGDEVYTSGLTLVPEGIKIGKVKNIKKDELELEYILDIESISLHNLKYLGVISL